MEFIIPAIIFTLASIIVLIMLLRIPKREPAIYRGSMATSLLVAFTSATYMIPSDWQLASFVDRTMIVTLLAGATLLSFGYVIFSYLRFHPRKSQIQTIWLAGVVIWLVAYLMSSVVVSNMATTLEMQSIPNIIGLAGVGLLGGSLVFVLLWNYYHVTLPELANRSAYWVFLTLFMSAGVAFCVSGLSSLIIPGITFIFLGLIGLLYGYASTQLLDVRIGLVMSIRNLALLTLSTTAILTPIYLIDRLNLTSSIEGLLTSIALATIIGSLSLPIAQLIRNIFNNFSLTTQTNLSLAIATYSREVSLSTNLEEVVNATTSTINQVLGIKRSGLILINNTFRKPNAVEFVVLSGVPVSSGGSRLTYISKDSPIYLAFSRDRAAVTQFSIDFDPAFTSMPQTERKFFQSLYLRAYAPIVTENNLIGIIGCGPKLNDTPYTKEELELLIVIGQQVGTALRSARLIDDLRHLNTSMRSLNSQLQIAKQDLEKLDSIKTDFVTIASHELRTPLAQVRGYTDIIDSLNDQDILDQKQTKTLVGNLRRATERMEELISAMMDVSQLDVNAMDLRFVRTKPDTIVRLAIDPLKDAIEQRNLAIETKELTELPAIQADMQRIVQAFSNIIVNAIKFTPDGGKIEISGSTEVRDETDHILFAIKDTGVGIQPHDIELIFQKFYRGFDPQLHSSGTYKFMGAGPGLGTTIAKGIIEGHGGKIWAESPGHDMKELPGATFYISMPVNPPEDARRVLPIDSEPASPSQTEDRKTAEIPIVTSNTSNPLQSLTGRDKPTEAKKPTEG